MRKLIALFFILFSCLAFSQKQQFKLILSSPLDSIPENLSSFKYTIPEADRNLKPITTVSGKRLIALDTVVIRWAKVNNSIEYKGSLKDIFDAKFFKFDAASNAILLVPSKFPSSTNLYFVHIERTIEEDFEWGLEFPFEVLPITTRLKVKSIVSKMDVNQRIDYFIDNNLVIDALTTIELELLKKENQDLVSKYWEIVNSF